MKQSRLPHKYGQKLDIQQKRASKFEKSKTRINREKHKPVTFADRLEQYALRIEQWAAQPESKSSAQHETAMLGLMAFVGLILGVLYAVWTLP